jgi:hypothetical protein
VFLAEFLYSKTEIGPEGAVRRRQLAWTFHHSCLLATYPGPRSFLALVPLDLAVPVLETGSVAAFEWPCWWQAAASTRRQKRSV